MHFSALLAAVATFAAHSAVAVECVNGLYVLVGRGTSEPRGMGQMGAIADLIVSEIPGSAAVAIDYPATFDDPSVIESVELGVQEVHKQVVQYDQDCPGHKMAYLGFSQGALIASNAFCGGQGSPFGDKAPIPANAVKNVVAIGLFGDPSFTESAPYNRGTAVNTEGLVSRDNIGACANYVGKMASYCNRDDRYCDMDGSGDPVVHGQYFEVNGQELKDFVVGKYKAVVEGSAQAGSKKTLDARSTTLIAMRAASTSTSTSLPTSTGSVSGSATSSPTHRNAAAGGVNINGMLFSVASAILAAVYVSV